MPWWVGEHPWPRCSASLTSTTHDSFELEARQTLRWHHQPPPLSGNSRGHPTPLHARGRAAATTTTTTTTPPWPAPAVRCAAAAARLGPRGQGHHRGPRHHARGRAGRGGGHGGVPQAQRRFGRRGGERARSDKLRPRPLPLRPRLARRGVHHRGGRRGRGRELGESGGPRRGMRTRTIRAPRPLCLLARPRFSKPTAAATTTTAAAITTTTTTTPSLAAVWLVADAGGGQDRV